jgi:PKD repeat protein
MINMYSFFNLNHKGRIKMTKIAQRGVLIMLFAVIACGLSAAAVTFTDQDIDKGYVNPGDQVVVQKIEIVDGSSTISSAWIRNLGDANGTDIVRIVVDDDTDPFTDPLQELTTLTNLGTGIVFSLDYDVSSGTHYLYIGVEIAGADKVAGGEQIQFRMQFFSGSYTSPYITDGSPETIFKGGFEEKADDSPSAGYLNPGDIDVPVQESTFTDNDGNNAGVEITKVSVKNLESAVDTDITDVEVTVTDGAVTYTAHAAPGNGDWGSANAMVFTPGVQVLFPDGAEVAVEVTVTVGGTPEDKHKVKTQVILSAKEDGNDDIYEQSITASTTQTIRVQGFEATRDISPDLASGVLGPGEKLTQVVRVTDDDVNGAAVTINGIWVKNEGDATKEDIDEIVVKKGETTLFTLAGGDIVDFATGHEYTVGFAANIVPDDESATLSIVYTIDGTITDGHTLKPSVYFVTEENIQPYDSDKVTYPKSIVLHPHGLEDVINVSPPNGGTAYSGQRLLAQKINCKDLDENDDSVRINPVTVKNIATSACAESEIVKIEVMTASGDLLGSVTNISGLNAGGIPISTLTHNTVADDHTLTLHIYVTFAGPEDVTAGHKLRLETTIFSEEDGHTGSQTAKSAEWTLAINHRPTCDFDYEPSEDLTHETEITFTAKNVSDSDGDDIVSHSWKFSDGTAATGTTAKHTFASGGSVWAELIVEDERGLTGSKRKTFEVEPPPVVPIAGFTWEPEAPSAGEEVQFTDASTTPEGTTIAGWEWDFGDEETSTDQNPTHSYESGGTYTATLTVTNSDEQTDEVTREIVVSSLKPTADFDYSPAAPDVDQTITFTDKSTGSGEATIESWSWSFGDGGTSTAKNPTHSYGIVGTYTVTLTVTDSNEETSNAHTERITVGPPVMVYSYPNPAENTASIVYRVPNGYTDPVLYIYNIDGALILEEELAVGGSPYTWDLKSTSGTAQPNGLYLCVVVAKDAGGGTKKSPIFKLLIAR